MAKRNRIKELENRHHDLETEVLNLVNKGGQALAARELNVSQATISLYLSRAGYRPKTIYVKRNSA